MTLRYVCDIDGLTDNWVDIDEVWTRKEVRDISSARGDDLMAWLKSKVVACHLARVAGPACTDPAELSEELLDELDLRLVDFVATVLVQAANHLRSLGNLSGRLSLNGAVPAPVTTEA